MWLSFYRLWRASACKILDDKYVVYWIGKKSIRVLTMNAKTLHLLWWQADWKLVHSKATGKDGTMTLLSFEGLIKWPGRVKKKWQKRTWIDYRRNTWWLRWVYANVRWGGTKTEKKGNIKVKQWSLKIQIQMLSFLKEVNVAWLKP